MRNFLRSDGWLTSCSLALALLGFAGCGGGCAGKGQYNPTTGVYDTNAMADVTVVAAETARKAALNVFAALMKFEKDNDAVLRKLNPEIHTFTEKIRRDSEKWLDAVTAAKVAYQKSRSAADASKLNDALKFLDSMLDSAAKHLAEASNATKAPP